jgi:hypothetical protein
MVGLAVVGLLDGRHAVRIDEAGGASTTSSRVIDADGTGILLAIALVGWARAS